jgi:hypothetical protein
VPAADAAQFTSDKDDDLKKQDDKSAAQRKRVGRPLAYNGDPDAPHLTDQERRKIKR